MVQSTSYSSPNPVIQALGLVLQTPVRIQRKRRQRTNGPKFTTQPSAYVTISSRKHAESTVVRSNHISCPRLKAETFTVHSPWICSRGHFIQGGPAEQLPHTSLDLPSDPSLSSSCTCASSATAFTCGPAASYASSPVHTAWYCVRLT